MPRAEQAHLLWTRGILLGAAALLMTIATSDVSWGQSGSRGGSNFRRPSARPFRNTLNRPTVSPYLNLVTPGGALGNSATYQTLVRPQIDAFNNAARNRADFNRLQRQVTQLRGASARPSQPQSPFFTTGHPTLFFGYSHYYPALGR